jgi:hypothetical protein
MPTPGSDMRGGNPIAGSHANGRICDAMTNSWKISVLSKYHYGRSLVGGGLYTAGLEYWGRSLFAGQITFRKSSQTSRRNR